MSGSEEKGWDRVSTDKQMHSELREHDSWDVFEFYNTNVCCAGTFESGQLIFVENEASKRSTADKSLFFTPENTHTALWAGSAGSQENWPLLDGCT